MKSLAHLFVTAGLLNAIGLLINYVFIVRDDLRAEKEGFSPSPVEKRRYWKLQRIRSLLLILTLICEFSAAFAWMASV